MSHIKVKMMINETYNDLSCGRESEEIVKFSNVLWERSMIVRLPSIGCMSVMIM